MGRNKRFCIVTGATLESNVSYECMISKVSDITLPQFWIFTLVIAKANFSDCQFVTCNYLTFTSPYIKRYTSSSLREKSSDRS